MNYTAYTDGACRLSNPGLCACGFICYNDGIEVHRSARVLMGLTTNNVSEYTGLIDLLEWAARESVQGITIYSDSKLVVEQANARWNVRPELQAICGKAFMLLQNGSHNLFHVKGHAGIAGNEAVDALCNEILDKYQGIPAKTAKKTRKS